MYFHIPRNRGRHPGVSNTRTYIRAYTVEPSGVGDRQRHKSPPPPKLIGTTSARTGTRRPHPSGREPHSPAQLGECDRPFWPQVPPKGTSRTPTARHARRGLPGEFLTGCWGVLVGWREGIVDLGTVTFDIAGSVVRSSCLKHRAKVERDGWGFRIGGRGLAVAPWAVLRSMSPRMGKKANKPTSRRLTYILHNPDWGGAKGGGARVRIPPRVLTPTRHHITVHIIASSR